MMTRDLQSGMESVSALAEMADHSTPAETLRLKEAFNFALFQYNPAPTVVVDEAGKTVKSNLARRRSRQGLPSLGKPLFDPEAGKECEELHLALVDCIRVGNVRYFDDKTIGDRSLAVTMAPFPGGAIVTTQDITEQKQAQEQLIQADKLVALGTLVSGVAHEISNPNNVLLLSASALKNLVANVSVFMDEHRAANGDFDIGALSSEDAVAELQDMVETVRRASERIRDTVKDLKEFARKGTGELTQEVDVNKVVEAAVRLLQPVINKATHDFRLACGESLPTVRLNAQRLEQVVVNLITNACQALTEPGQRISITTRHVPEEGRVIVEVSDGGQGIAEQDLKRITDPFFTTKQDCGGTGLGLSISRKIIEQYGGSLCFASEWQKGTTAAIMLSCVAEK